MALRFIESFDTYATAQLTEGRWTAAEGWGSDWQANIVPGVGRRGTAALRLITGFALGGLASVSKTLGPQATWIVGFAFRRFDFVAGIEVCSLRDGGTAQIEVILQPDGLLLVTRNSTPLGTTAVALNTGTYHFLELKATMHNTLGSVVLRLDGVPVLALSNVDTQATSNAWATSLTLGSKRIGGGAAGVVTSEYDDVYICDGTGPAPYTDCLGDCRVDATFPTSDVLQQWTPSSGTLHYALVDEAVPDTTDYLEATSLGLSDHFTKAALPTLTTPRIFAVAVNLYARNPEAGSRQIAAQVQSSGTTGSAAPLPLTDAWLLQQSLFLDDPHTTAPWTQAAVNAATVGVTVAG